MQRRERRRNGERRGDKDEDKKTLDNTDKHKQHMQFSQLAIYLVSSYFYFLGGLQITERR